MTHFATLPARHVFRSIANKSPQPCFADGPTKPKLFRGPISETWLGQFRWQLSETYVSAKRIFSLPSQQHHQLHSTSAPSLYVIWSMSGGNTVIMRSEVVHPRFPFSHDVSELQRKQDVPRKDTMLLESNHDFEFSTSTGLESESSSADELFSNGVILPIQMQQKRNSTRKHTLYGEAQYMRLPPLPCAPSVDKVKRESVREVLAMNGGYCDRKTHSTSFWGFSRSRSLNCDAKKSLTSNSPPLSRSNSTGSAPHPKRVSSTRAKPLSSSSSSTLNLYPVQRSHSGKGYGGSYANDLRISPVLNLPIRCISKGSASFFGWGSILRVGKANKSKE
ncbi:hypothetical protein Fmac_003761 [Flemingia macrophylla]|uniref:Uncharacterized protein n=1 Tax=Flemingia macrophylla TaxID=520843 RepID=A0ABD1N2Z8_9FABA